MISTESIQRGMARAQLVSSCAKAAAEAKFSGQAEALTEAGEVRLAACEDALGFWMPDAAPDSDPVFFDSNFHTKKKKGVWRMVQPPVITATASTADTHAHLHMLEEPALSLARCACDGMSFIGAVTDPSEDGDVLFECLDEWLFAARTLASAITAKRCARCMPVVPKVRITAGVHPHNARLYTDELERHLLELLADPRVSALGEIGLDYHYDLSPRESQRTVFARQLELAEATGLPVALHIREAHDDALAILREVGFPRAGVILHCCSLSAAELAPWIEAGCYIAYGGALTFNNGDAAREGAPTVPLDRLLTETDSPYMAPVPLRGTSCQPDYVAFSVQKLADVRGCTTRAQVIELAQALLDNARAMLDREPTPWQIEHASVRTGDACGEALEGGGNG